MINLKFQVKNTVVILAFIFVACMANSEQLHLQLQLHPGDNLLVVYDKLTGQPYLMEWNFQSTNIVIDDKYKKKSLFFDAEKAFQFTLGFKINYQASIQYNLGQQFIVIGSVGLGKNNQFMTQLKQIFNSTQIKLWFQLLDHSVQVIPLRCFKPIFPPYKINAKGITNETFLIKNPSFNLLPDSNFFRLINKTKTKFRMSGTQLNNTIELKIQDETQTIRIRQVLKDCQRVPNTLLHQCSLELVTGDKVDMGLLLMLFDPVICSQGIQLQPTTGFHQHASYFYWFHLAMIVLQVVGLLFFLNRQKANNIWKLNKRNKINHR